MIRIGHGYDVHAFGEGDHVILGGVSIPFNKGLIAHSDGDVVLHALADSLLGAAALGDIGAHFPDTDKQYKDADSRVLLRHVWNLVCESDCEVGNVDITIIAQVPKMAPHIQSMRKNNACLLYTSDAADEEESLDLACRRTNNKHNTNTRKLHDYYTKQR
mgnify:CR=1 FL=1